MAFQDYMKPCPGGYQIQAADVLTYGTLWATVEWDGKLAAITAAHIVDSIGAPAFQPSWYTKPDEVHIIGPVSGKSAHLQYGSSSEYGLRREDMLYDFAWIAPVAGATDGKIPGIYGGTAPLKTRDPKEGEPVAWIGMSTGAVQHGKVVDADLWVFRMNRRSKKYESFGPCIRIEGGVSVEGDSGAAIVSQDDGLVIGVFSLGGEGSTFMVASKIPPTAQDLIQHSTQTVSEAVLLERLAKWKKGGLVSLTPSI
ncbi:hypothetical protein ACGFNX_34950 [Streptomyces sp. NPDC048723]|uniref:hypothetical protein n=1 Tax=Streptomyces sp. NPDC048723 TaxID=3365589 RepID=UPI003716424A